ncbi:MAG: DUF6494 family protein [Pseudomonadota bacterium]
MSDDDFNMSMRKFLKQVGVTSQQEIERAIREARAAGKLSGGTVKARMVLTLEGADLNHVVEGDIQVGTV